MTQTPSPAFATADELVAWLESSGATKFTIWREADGLHGKGTAPKRRKASGPTPTYTGSFDLAWRTYGRKEEKAAAFIAWIAVAATVGGELVLLDKVLTALAWQGPMWAADGWKFARYFERYLKRRKFEDERPPMALGTAAVAVRQAPESFAARDARERVEREQKAREARMREEANRAESARIIAEADAERERGRGAR